MPQPAAINADPACFAELGYCLYRDVFNTDEATATRALLDEALSTAMGADSSIVRPDYVGEPHSRDCRWLELCRHPRLLDAVESILGPNLILVYSSVFIKNPDTPKSVGWHQDNTYWPSVHGTEVATVWLAIDDADEDNSAMQVIPGTHLGHESLDTVAADKNQMLSQKIEVAPGLEETAVTLAMSAGSLSIHDSFLLHGSDQNRTARRRAGYTIRYCSTDTAWVDVTDHPIPIYVVRGRGGQRSAGYIDLGPDVVMTDKLFEKAAVL